MTLPVIVECLAPMEVEKADADAFKALVLEAGEVSAHSFPYLYNDTVALAFARSDGKLVGIGAIKRPSPEYRERIFKQAGSDMRAASFPYELAWMLQTGRETTCSPLYASLSAHSGASGLPGSGRHPGLRADTI